jgi:hypothetical protein
MARLFFRWTHNNALLRRVPRSLLNVNGYRVGDNSAECVAPPIGMGLGELRSETKLPRSAADHYLQRRSANWRVLVLKALSGKLGAGLGFYQKQVNVKTLTGVADSFGGRFAAGCLVPISDIRCDAAISPSIRSPRRPPRAASAAP